MQWRKSLNLDEYYISSKIEEFPSPVYLDRTILAWWCINQINLSHSIKALDRGRQSGFDSGCERGTLATHQGGGGGGGGGDD